METILRTSATSLTRAPTVFWSKSLENPSLCSSSSLFSVPHKTPFHSHNFSNLTLSFTSSCFASSSTKTGVSIASSPPITSIPKIPEQKRHWMVLMESPPEELNSKPEIIDYYVKTLQNVLGSEQDAQMSIYDASCTTNFGFCCFIDPEAARALARLPSVIEVKPDADINSTKKRLQLKFKKARAFLLFPAGTTKRWRVQVYKPPARIVTKAQVVDYYVQILTEVLGNEQDAQMCICDISWQSSYEFFCELDNKSAQELTGVYGVLSVHLDQNLESEKIITDDTLQDPSSLNQANHVKTKKIFITGLSFYTSEKTLREAFEGFGEIVAVNIIMDKISKRSKGYGFIEYTTEEAASVALKEMNGKIINGWMITVDVAKKNPIKYSRGRPIPE